jgi:hypothetical protein
MHRNASFDFRICRTTPWWSWAARSKSRLSLAYWSRSHAGDRIFQGQRLGGHGRFAVPVGSPASVAIVQVTRPLARSPEQISSWRGAGPGMGLCSALPSLWFKSRSCGLVHTGAAVLATRLAGGSLWLKRWRPSWCSAHHCSVQPAGLQSS